MPCESRKFTNSEGPLGKDWHLGQSRPAGARHRDRERQDLPGSGTVLQPREVDDVPVGQPPLGGEDEQRPSVRTAEHQRERRAVLGGLDVLQYTAALGDAHDRERPRGCAAAGPDRAFGVQGRSPAPAFWSGSWVGR